METSGKPAPNNQGGHLIVNGDQAGLPLFPLPIARRRTHRMRRGDTTQVKGVDGAPGWPETGTLLRLSTEPNRGERG